MLGPGSGGLHRPFSSRTRMGQQARRALPGLRDSPLPHPRVGSPPSSSPNQYLPPRHSRSSTEPAPPRPQHLDRPHLPGPQRDQDLAGPPFTAPGTLPPHVPPRPATLAGGPRLHPTGAILTGPGGGIYQILSLAPNDHNLIVQRWLTLPTGPGRPRAITRAGHPTTLPITDFTHRCTHRLLVLRGCGQRKGTIRTEIPDTPCLTSSTPPSWVEPLRLCLPSTHSWSLYSDSSWRRATPLQAKAVFGLQGSHHGRGALFFSADLPDWCSDISAASFEIPLTLRALGGSAYVAELLAIHAGLHLLSTLRLRGTVYTDCLSAVKKINRRWFPGSSFQEAGATLVGLAGLTYPTRSPSSGLKDTLSSPTNPPPFGPDTNGAYISRTLSPRIGTSVPYPTPLSLTSGPSPSLSPTF